LYFHEVHHSNSGMSKTDMARVLRACGLVHDVSTSAGLQGCATALIELANASSMKDFAKKVWPRQCYL
jgi:hypothetical protein